MKSRLVLVLLVYLVLLSVWAQRGNAQDKIVGPWLWMCVKLMDREVQSLLIRILSS